MWDEEMSRMEEAMAVYGDVFAKYCTYHAKPYDGIKEMLERLKKEGVFLAVLSNKPDGQTRDVVRTFFGDHFFDAVQGQKEGIPRKPDPAAVLSILERAGITRRSVFTSEIRMWICTPETMQKLKLSVSVGDFVPKSFCMRQGPMW